MKKILFFVVPIFFTNTMPSFDAAVKLLAGSHVYVVGVVTYDCVN